MSNTHLQQKAGNYLRKLMAENELSQEDFAFDFGCDVRSVSRYVNQGIDKVGLIQEIADYFQVDFMDFFKD